MNTSEEIEQAKKLLQDNGYQESNLWHIDDVQSRFKCSDIEAMKILTKALDDEYNVGEIISSIVSFGEEDGFEQIED